MEERIDIKETHETRAEIGSRTAKGGFRNEHLICEKFNNWKIDLDAQRWLRKMKYNPDIIESINAIQIPVRIGKNKRNEYNILEAEFEELVRFKKADAQIIICIKIGDCVYRENLSIKKSNSNADYNQIDKRTVANYQEMWKFDDDIAHWLKLFTGDIIADLKSEKIKDMTKEKRRIYLNQMPEEVQNKIIKFFTDNKILVISDILKGRGGFAADWMIVTKCDKDNSTITWTLHDINVVMNFYGFGDVIISKRGSLKIGRITLQRKGGTPDPTKLQFKFKPCQIFELDN